MPNKKITDILLNLPDKPGVYRMLEENGTILYVGKARNLKKRVSQYFQKNLTHPKTKALIQRIDSIDITVTSTETEALLLENTLIKTHQPKYNILLRDDKTYPYLYINTTHPYPSLVVYRGKTKPRQGLFFGPYPNTFAVHQTLNILQKCFQLRHCHDTMFASRSRPCLQYQIKRCSAPCTDYISQQDYAKSLAQAIAFLEGKSTDLIQSLTQKMEQAIQSLAFEDAAVIRDHIRQLHVIQQPQSMIKKDENVDVVAINAQSEPLCIEHVVIRHGNLLSHQTYTPKLPDISLSEEDDTDEKTWALFDAFIRFYYLDNPQAIPATLLVYPPLAGDALENYLAFFKKIAQRVCRIRSPRNSDEEKWLAFAMENLQIYKSQIMAKKNKRQNQLTLLQKILDLTEPILSIACFDISHSKGEATYASCVVFDQTGPVKADYRRFIITDITPGDDYAALQQAVSKYYDHLVKHQRSFPTLLLIDGGKGQANAIRELLPHLPSPPLNILGITKGLNRLARYDRIFDSHHHRFLSLSPYDEALHLLQNLRDEAHRFALTSHRKKRASQQLASTLDDIEGIGSKRKKMLLQHFGGLQALSQASYEALCDVPGISPTLADRLLKHFSKKS